MRILISSHRFAPDVGGIETVSGLLAAEWRRLGHDVQVVTQTLARSAADESPVVHRRPAPARLFALVRDCDICWHSNISLQTAWPLLFVRRPWFITPNTWLHGVDGRVGWRDRLKRLAHARAINLYPSEPLAAHVGLPGTRVRNPYESTVFHLRPEVARSRDLVFVGRLVSDKGADVLLRALHRLAPELRPKLTIVGEGPEQPALLELAAQLGLSAQLHWAGTVQGTALAELLNGHRVLVMPSRSEPFGIVAVLGLACGCRVIASNTGGLPEAVGTVGTLFPVGDDATLARKIAVALAAPPADSDAPAIRAHLASFGAAEVAAHYLRLFRAALDERPA